MQLKLKESHKSQLFIEKMHSKEFGNRNDPFFNARHKGPVFWILKHIFFGQNMILLSLWLFFVIISTYLSSYVMVLMGEAIDALGDMTSDNYMQVITFFSISLLIIGIVTPLVAVMGNFMREILAQKMERDTRHEFYLNLLGKSQSIHDQLLIGDIMARTADDVRMLNWLISPAVSLIVESIISIIIPLILIITNYPSELLLMPIIFIIIFIISVRRYYLKLGPVTDEIRSSFGMMNAKLNETLSGIEVVKGLTMEDTELRKYKEMATKIREASIKEGDIESKYFPILLVVLIITGGLVHGLILIDFGYPLGTGALIGYIGLLYKLRRPTFISIWAFSIVSRAKSAAQRLLEVMNKQGSLDENRGGEKRRISGKVEFNNVTFTYPGAKKPVLKNITFKVEPGQTTAIVGTTGSGKTTLTKLISRLYDLDSGEIKIDDINIKDYSLHSLRSQIAFIEQEIFLFSVPIKENIGFGKIMQNHEIDKEFEEEIIQAAKDAQAHEFIMNTPKGYDTPLGEKGVQLSGGERQRIAIARALLMNPRILILDDSTSAIDSATEEKIQKAIKRVLKGRTTFLITHRLSQIRWADLILVLQKGEIIARGTHEELMKNCSEYQKIFINRFDLNDYNKL